MDAGIAGQQATSWPDVPFRSPTNQNYGIPHEGPEIAGSELPVAQVGSIAPMPTTTQLNAKTELFMLIFKRKTSRTTETVLGHVSEQLKIPNLRTFGSRMGRIPLVLLLQVATGWGAVRLSCLS